MDRESDGILVVMGSAGLRRGGFLEVMGSAGLRLGGFLEVMRSAGLHHVREIRISRNLKPLGQAASPVHPRLLRQTWLLSMEKAKVSLRRVDRSRVYVWSRWLCVQLDPVAQ